MVKNWKKEAEYYEKQYNKYYKKWDDLPSWGGAFLLVVFLLFISLVAITIGGGFDAPIEKLDLDKDRLSEYHILKYYPEYENCSFEYKNPVEIDCELSIAGVEVFCEEVQPRDGMNILGNNPSLTLCFDDVSLNEVLEEIVSEYK